MLWSAGDSPLEAHAISDGQSLWTGSAGVTIRPAFADGAFFVVADGTLQALDEADGATRWTVPLDGPTTGLVAEGNLVLASVGASIRAFRITDGALVWRQALPTTPTSPLAVGAGAAAIVLNEKTLATFALADGAPRWQFPLLEPLAAMALANDRVYFGTSANACARKLDKTGSDLWCLRTRVQAVGVPDLDESRIYFTLFDNSVRELDRNNGATRRRDELPARPVSGPRRVGQFIVVALGDAEFVALNVTDGKVAATLTPPDVGSPQQLETSAVSNDGSILAMSSIAAGGKRSVTVFKRTNTPPPAAAPATTPAPTAPGAAPAEPGKPTAPDTTPPGAEPAKPNPDSEPTPAMPPDTSPAPGTGATTPATPNGQSP